MTPLNIAHYLLKYMDPNDRIRGTEMPSDCVYKNLIAKPKAGCRPERGGR
jgi:hypothetical protein